MIRLALIAATATLALTACSGKDADGDGIAAAYDCDDDDAAVGLPGAWFTDADGDGFGDGPSFEECAPTGASQVDGDCDDSIATVFPGAEELCNAVDDNCNGTVDEGLPVSVHYPDGDADGYGRTEDGAVSCGGDGLTDAAGDCDDANPDVFPTADELCNGVDDDCDTDIDEDAADATTFYGDADGDGYGRDDITTLACDLPVGYAAPDGDCDDADPDIFPGAPELCNGADDDCDELIDEDAADATVWYDDVDGDGYGDPATALAACDPPSGTVSVPGDCDDTDPELNPDTWWFPDADGDGYGLITDGIQQCDAPKGYGRGDGDCDDADPDVNPGMLELCNGVDDDCDAVIDEEAADATAYWEDADGDGFGAPGTDELLCADPGLDYALVGDDCDDEVPAINPDAIEVCDGVDNDCDALVDDSDPSVDATRWAIDIDGDTYGDPADVIAQCATPGGRVPDATDCDDADALVNPGATEVCNAIDDDCDGVVDGPDSEDALPFYGDGDEDGYGDASDLLWDCEAPSGYSAVGTDCNDANPMIHPYAPEDCGSPVDLNCDGSPGAIDSDGDGFASCEECDDADPSAYPGALELCDEVDNDCNEIIDDGLGDAWFLDVDGDGFGDGPPLLTCFAPSGYVLDDGDCDDGDLTINPAATEVCNGVDDNCDGVLPADERDLDGDGVSPCEGDPDDTDPTVGACVFSSDSFAETFSFLDAGALEQTRMNMTWDGVYYWSSSGGSSSGNRISQFDAAGVWLADYAPGRDVRSVFTIGDGTAPTYLRAYGSADLEVQTSPGTYGAYLTLSGGSLDAQSAVVWDPTRDQFVAFEGGTLSRWDATGTNQPAIAFSGFGVGTEDVYPQNRGVAVTPGGCYLTFADGQVSSWDETGARLDTATLIGVGSSFDSYFSFSYANGMVFVIDDALGTWRGYDVGM